jgi:hypothetical protein
LFLFFPSFFSSPVSISFFPSSFVPATQAEGGGGKAQVFGRVFLFLSFEFCRSHQPSLSHTHTHKASRQTHAVYLHSNPSLLPFLQSLTNLHSPTLRSPLPRPPLFVLVDVLLV